MVNAPNRYNIIRALARSAFRVAQASNNVTGDAVIPDAATVTPTSVLEGIIVGKFNAEITDGRILIHSAEAGGVTQFAMLPDMSPAEIIDIIEETITWIQAQADPLNPPLYVPRRIKRLRASFAKSVI
jgi:hypothetical protein